MKRIILLSLALSCCLLYGCSSSKEPASSESLQSSSIPEAVSETSKVSSAAVSSSVSQEEQELLGKISVTYLADTLTDDSGNQRMLIDIANKTDKVFSGDISVTFVENEEILGFDVFSINNFKPGNKTTVSLYITPTKHRVFVFDISDFTFAEDSATSSGKIDEEKSKALTDHMYEGFGGSGKKNLRPAGILILKKLKSSKTKTAFMRWQ